MKEFIKYPKIEASEEAKNSVFIDGDELVIEEKMDGANFRFFITKDNKIIFGSRTQQMTSDEGEETNVQKNFRKCVEFIRNKLSNKNLDNYKSRYIFFGECMIKHSLEYDWDRTPIFLGYDIYDLEQNKFIDYDKKREIFSDFGFDIVHLIKRGRWNSDITEKDLEVPKSVYVNNYAEGIVIKNYDKQTFTKIVSDKFKEVNRNTFGMNKRYAKDDTEYFVAMYCTNPRIDKWIFKLIDEGNELHLKLMHLLPNKVFYDIWEENWKDIIESKKIIDLNKMKKLVSQRCLEVLKQQIRG